MKNSKRVAWVLLFLCAHTPAWGNEYRLKFIPAPHPNETISNLKWENSQDMQEPEIQIRAKEKEGPPYFVKLNGAFLKLNRTLLFEKQPIRLDGMGKFTIEVAVEGDSQEFSINEIDEAGKITTQISELRFPDWGQFIDSQNAVPKKRWSLQPGLGLSFINYLQSSYIFNQWALNGILDSSYWLKPDRWSLDFSGTITLLPISSNLSGNWVRLMELNLSAGYQFPIRSTHWIVRVLTGGYYFTSFPSNTHFGFGNITGPQLISKIQYAFSSEKAMGIYLKYSPILNGLGLLAPMNLQASLGADYEYPIFKAQHMKVKLDLNYIRLVLGSGNYSLTSVLFGLSYSF